MTEFVEFCFYCLKLSTGHNKKEFISPITIYLVSGAHSFFYKCDKIPEEHIACGMAILVVNFFKIVYIYHGKYYSLCVSLSLVMQANISEVFI